METFKDMTNLEPDFLSRYSEEELDEINLQLSEKEEQIFKEILEIEQNAKGKPELMEKLLDAAKKGALEYLDSMTDTGNSFSDRKRSEGVRQLDDTEISPINTSANKIEADSQTPRTMRDANTSALKSNPKTATIGMSDEGKRRFEKYQEAYSQRTKSLNQLSTDGNHIKRSDTDTNLDTLSGLRGYRIGPVVAMPTPQQAKEGYAQYIEAHKGTGKTESSWLYEQNMKDFDNALAKELGFRSAGEAEKWRKENNLTVHEGPDGMFMVPSDVHSAARHDGYRTLMSKCMKGEVSEEEVKEYVIKEKIAYAKHEAKERSIRMAKGIGLTAMKEVVKCGIIVLVDETHNEFKQEKEDSFVFRMMRILRNSWIHVKNKFKDIISNLWKNIKGSILSEFLTLLNDFFFKTFKNVFKVVRQMWSSLKSAFKIIFSGDPGISFGERIFEASKVLAAGVTSLIGFSLNELIEKGLTSIGIPFASFIAECLSGLFAGIMAAIVVMLFDSIKDKFMATSPAVQKMQLQAKAIAINGARVTVSSLKTDMKMAKTYRFIYGTFCMIVKTRNDILQQQHEANVLNQDIKIEVENQNRLNENLKEMYEKYEKDNI